MPVQLRFILLTKIYKLSWARNFSSGAKGVHPAAYTEIEGKRFERDKITNVTPNILKHLGRQLHLQQYHPLCLLKQRLVNYFYQYSNKRGNPLFSVYDRVNPVVTTQQNFDSLLIPPNHVSRQPSDCYYLNEKYLLRGHTSAHQAELLASGLNAFLVVGDVYRRDEIDATHYPVFHQMEGVRLFHRHELFEGQTDEDTLQLFERPSKRTPDKQETHTLEADKLIEHNLKTCLGDLAKHLFGPETQTRWTNTYFPFTHPSWEMEVEFQGKWLELMGCGVVEQSILNRTGAADQVGWAFGLGLERLAMRLYNIPDIRVFWSKDMGFLSQFEGASPTDNLNYKPVSQYPPLLNDLSFWLPATEFSSNDFYDLVRTIGGDIVEQVRLIDSFTNKKTQRQSHCYRIVYRHMDRTLTQNEVNDIHKTIEVAASELLKVTIR